MTSFLDVRGISKEYDNRLLLNDISFRVEGGEILCLLGPSGTGKTTLLRIIAGLEEADAGEVICEGRNLQGVPPHARGFGLMFQDLALFPHRNVFENVAFGLRMQHAAASTIQTRVNEALELVGLQPAQFAARDVNRLSGGEQQRVALARTLAPRPRLIMFDEPLGALDRILREELVDELRHLLKRLHLTALYVTHDQDEAFAIADRLALLNEGRIEQSGTPLELYNAPANAFVARFMGLNNVIPVDRVEPLEGAGAANARWRVQTPLGSFTAMGAVDGTNARFVLLRPRAVERVRATREATENVATENVATENVAGENVLRGQVIETPLRSGHQRLVLATASGDLAFEWDAAVRIGDTVELELDAKQIELL